MREEKSMASSLMIYIQLTIYFLIKISAELHKRDMGSCHPSVTLPVMRQKLISFIELLIVIAAHLITIPADACFNP